MALWLSVESRSRFIYCGWRINLVYTEMKKKKKKDFIIPTVGKFASLPKQKR